jgi:dTDP-4-dehydrorhamnose reductase
LPAHIILRTSWVYNAEGANFVRTMLRLGAERDLVRVVADQRGSPTSADDIAGAALSVAERLAAGDAGPLFGTYHMTGQGQTTWHGFAAEIFRLAAERGLKAPGLEAITTADHPTPARRPANSVLDNSKFERAFGLRLPPWQESLVRCIDAIVLQSQSSNA